MVQFNLLPNVKLEYVKTERTKHLLTLVSVIVSATSVGVFVLAFATVKVVQKHTISTLDSDIKKYSNQLTSVKDLNKILTVQNQLSTLTDLHNKKPVAGRLFGMMSQVTPADASLNDLKVDFTAGTFIMTGKASSLETVSAYTTNLKGTKYKIKGSDTASQAFKNVVLTAFSKDEKSASFTISLNFDPELFNVANEISLSMPQGASADTNSVFEGSK